MAVCSGTLNKEKIVFSWSGGKDSALALHEVLRSGRYDVVSLITTIASPQQRICMHGVRESLLEDQAKALGVSPEAGFLTQAAAQCDGLAGQAGPGANAPELGILRTALAGRNIPPVCAGF